MSRSRSQNKPGCAKLPSTDALANYEDVVADYIREYREVRREWLDFYRDRPSHEGNRPANPIWFSDVRPRQSRSWIDASRCGAGWLAVSAWA